jgi:hypothetical protein
MNTAIRYEGSNVVIDITSTHKVYKVVPDFIDYNILFREIRDGCIDKMRTCKVCMRDFELNEKLSLLVTDSGNYTICSGCRDNVNLFFKQLGRDTQTVWPLCDL